MATTDTKSNLLPEANYEAVIDTFGLSESKAGAPQFAVSFKITEEGPHKGKNIMWFGSLKEGKPMDITIKSLTVMGMKSDDLDDKNLLDKSTPVQLVIRHETWDGKTNARVKFINKIGGGSFKAIGDGAKVSLSLKDKIRASQARLAQEGNADASANVPVAGAPPPAADDDIPF